MGENLLQYGQVLLQVAVGGLAGQRLDAADAGGDRAFADDLEYADLAAGVQMGAAAQFTRKIAHGDHAHRVAVLFLEYGDGAGLDGLLVALRAPVHRQVLADLFVDGVLDLLQFVGAQGAVVGEVEAQLVGPDPRAGLLDVQAQDLAQGGVQHVGGGVVDGDLLAPAGIHFQPDPVADLQTSLLHLHVVQDGAARGLLGVARP